MESQETSIESHGAGATAMQSQGKDNKERYLDFLRAAPSKKLWLHRARTVDWRALSARCKAAAGLGRRGRRVRVPARDGGAQLRRARRVPLQPRRRTRCSTRSSPAILIFKYKLSPRKENRF